MIKARTKAFADKLIENPNMSQVQAYIETHETNNRLGARANASQLLSKPEVLAYMAKKSETAEKAVIQVLQNAKKNKDSVQWQRLTLDSAAQILDRVHGKPITRTNNTNLNVSLEQLMTELQ